VAENAGGLPRQVGHGPRVADGVRRLHVGEVGDGFQRGIEGRAGQPQPQAQPLGQPQGDQALAQDMLHRLAHAQVGRQRQDAKQFGQADDRARGGLCHKDE